MYDCLVESQERVKKGDKGKFSLKNNSTTSYVDSFHIRGFTLLLFLFLLGGGAILAHCMGLGKTLQVVTLSHTLLTHKELGFTKGIVLCPLNVCLNWVDEFVKWTPEDSVDVYELSQIKVRSIVPSV